MSDELERMMLRRLTGDATRGEIERLDRAMAADGALAERWRLLADLWDDLELPPSAPAPESLIADLRSRGVANRRPSALWIGSPAWGRALAAAALAVGIGLGGWAGTLVGGDAESSVGVEPSLAESYFSAVQAAAEGGER